MDQFQQSVPGLEVGRKKVQKYLLEKEAECMLKHNCKSKGAVHRADKYAEMDVKEP